MSTSKKESDPFILGVRVSQWPLDELLSLPWHMVAHLTAEEKQRILDRAEVPMVERRWPNKPAEVV